MSANSPAHAPVLSRPAPEGRESVLAGAVIVLAALAAYGNSFSGPFVFLDVPAIVDNPTIRRLWPVGPVLSPPSDGGLTVGGRPALNLSLAANYAAGGLDVRGYHALNLAIHALAGLALFGILRRTFLRLGTPSPTLPAFAAALLWTVHPLQTESVTYVIQRAESLMGLCYLLTLYSFIRYADAVDAADGAGGGPTGGFRSRAWFIAAFAACLFGMATKEVMATAPVLVLLYDRVFLSGGFRESWRRHGRLHAALASTWLVLALLVASTGGNRGGTSGLGFGYTWWRYALTQFPAVTHYLRLGIWPHPLDFYSGAQWVGHPAWIAPQAALVLFLIAGTAGLLFLPEAPPGIGLRQSFGGDAAGRALGFAGAWFFAILAPTSLVPGISQTMAEHRIYLPLAAELAVVVCGAWALSGRIRRPAARSLLFLAPMLALAFVLAFLTHRRNEVYRSELALWSATAVESPDDPYVQNNLGIALVGADRLRDAAVHFEEAVRLRPGYAEAHNNLGLALVQTGRVAEAISEYEKALGLKSGYPEAEANLGIALANSGRISESISHLERALRLRPGYAEAHNNLAVILAGTGRMEDAIAHYKAFLLLIPDSPEAHYNLGNAFAQTGRQEEAIGQYEEAVRLKPDYSEAQANLGAALARAGRLKEAVAQYERALLLAPSDADVHYNLGLALRAEGREPEAQEQFQAAERLQPAKR